MDVILLVFFCWQIGKKAKEKGLKPGQWRFRLVLTWLGFEFMGLFIGILLWGFDKNDMLGLAAFALAFAFGGYLIIKAVLDKIPSAINEDDIDNIGVK